MPTGACGIDCDVCRLNVLGICSTCGSGRSREALRKIAAQRRILGAPCPILACAQENRVEYCPRDCEGFPCDRFKVGPYPFSQGYLNMQERRRKERPPRTTTTSSNVQVPTQYWDDLARIDMESLCRNALAAEYPPMGVLLPFLGDHLLVDKQGHSLLHPRHGQWQPVEDPLLELLCLLYLLNVGPEPVSNELISVKELKTAHFFRGPHEIRIRPLLVRYGNDPEGLRRAAERLGGEALDLADVAYKISTFPKVPLYYLFWKGDEEFKPRLSILFDRSIEHHLAADAIWGLVNLVSDRLLFGD